MQPSKGVADRKATFRGGSLDARPEEQFVGEASVLFKVGISTDWVSVRRLPSLNCSRPEEVQEREVV